MTSRDLVNIVTGRINAGIPRRQRVKVGHCGTLDPLATGVLVIGIGPAVRLTSFVGEQAKQYRATFRMGQSTVSGDLEGEITHHEELPMPDRSMLEASAANLIGEIRQIPPAHSAIKVDGVRAYKMAHAGKSVDMPERTVRVDSIEITRSEPPDFDANIVCGGGTYIRTLGIDLARGAGNVAVMTSLRRTGIGPFRIEDAVTIDQIRDNTCELPIQPLGHAVAHRRTIAIDAAESVLLGNGMPIPIKSDAENLSGNGNRLGKQGTDREDDEVPAMDPAGKLRAIVHRRRDCWYPKRVFPVMNPEITVFLKPEIE